MAYRLGSGGVAGAVRDSGNGRKTPTSSVKNQLVMLQVEQILIL